MITTTPMITYQQPRVIAEIGCNHMGQIDVAKELIIKAKECGCDYAKFQKRRPEELLTPEQAAAPHPVVHNAYGDTYLEHRKNLELTVDQHRELRDFCKNVGIGYSSSVWDVTSAKEIVSLKPDLIKVGSPSNLHWEMMKILRDEYPGEVHISTGMTTKDEVEKIVQFWECGDGNARHRVVLYNCTSGYPVAAKDICLLELAWLHSVYSSRVKALGFSGHHNGIGIDLAAYALGATWNERHFTGDRTWKGTDHAASLEPPGMARLCRDLNEVWVSMRLKETEILPVEAVQREKLKWGCYNANALQTSERC